MLRRYPVGLPDTPLYTRIAIHQDGVIPPDTRGENPPECVLLIKNQNKTHKTS